jgi:ribonuclease P protein component
LGGILKRLTFPKEKKLVSNKQFKVIMADGRCARNDLLILYMIENDCGYPRLGVSIGKIHGNAVTRNRLKRLMREAFRQNQERIPVNFDYLLMMSRSKRAKGCPSFKQVEDSFLSLVGSLENNRDSRGQ